MRVWVAILVLIGVSADWASESWIPVNSAARGETSRVVVQRSGAHSWQIQVSVSGLAVHPTIQNGRSRDRVELPAETQVAIQNLVEVPAISRFIGLRSDGDPSVEVISEEWTDIEGSFDLASSQDDGSSESSTTDAFLPESAIALTPRLVMGGVSLADLQITVVKYNPVQHKIRALRSLSVEVHENGGAVSYPRGITETIAQNLRPLIANWDELALDELVVRGTLLYITADTSVAPQQIQQLVAWRTRKGYRVEVAGPRQIGNPLSTTNVKSYIQSRYNNANPPLEFVCIVGDGNGNYVVPSYVYHAPDEVGVYGVGDFGFSQLDGTDLLPDIAIGRLFFTSSAELLTQVNKTLRYEQTPAPRNTGSHPNWYEAAGVVGDYDNQALSVSHIQTMRWVRERMLDAGYPSSSIDTLYWTDHGSGALQPSLIIASLNSGASLWCYRGWNRMNNFAVSNVTGLNNVGDWPFMLNLTCNTNDFNQADAPCLGEAFMVPLASPSNPTGAIGFVGMSSGGTHSRFNNIEMGGAVQGLLREGIHTTGGSLIRAKLEMIHNFPMSADQAEVEFFAGITSLLGDPAVDVYTDTPDTLSVNCPTSIAAGTNSLTLTVTKQGSIPVDSAYVNLVKGAEVFIGGYTDASGQITLNFLTTGADTMFVTASRHNGLSAIRYTLVTASAQYVGPSTSAFTLDDDNNGTSHGNGDGRANPGETIELAVPLRNWGTTSVSGVSATLSTTDPYIAGITDATEIYGTIAPGAIAVSADDYDITVASYAPQGHVALFTLTVSDGASHTWISTIPITLSNAALDFVSAILTGVGNAVLDPGESGQMYINLLNGGTRALTAGRIGYLRSGDPVVVITDSVGTFAALAAGGQGNNQSDPFGIMATTQGIPGERIPLTCTFPLSDGFADTVHFSLTIGTVGPNTPTPADGYGYWAFDNTDTAYVRHPTYNWVEIDPDSGGAGTHLALVDNTDGGDASMAVNLPFTFQYYGQDFNQITVCTNGWLAMGGDQVAHTDFRNYDIPSAIGASRLIAPFWDDLRTTQPIALAEDADGRGNADHSLDDGGETCTNPATISSLPYTDSGNTCQHNNSCGNHSQDVFYRYTVPSGGQSLQISLCGSSYYTRLAVYNQCPCSSAMPLVADSSSCTDGNARIISTFAAGNIWIMVEGWGQGPQSCGSYALNVSQFVALPPGHICTYNDAVNDRFIVEWSRVFKYNGMDNPRETFECILYQSGYPVTPTGDGDILFEYQNITNAIDVAASNDYCTAGIENLDQTDGVLYSYFNQVSPTIPGAAPLVSGRAVLFTTAKLPVPPPAAPTGLTVYVSGNSVFLRWVGVNTDILGNPLSNVQYNLYRGAQGDFVPGTGTFLTTVSDTTYSDDASAALRYFYIVQAVVGGASSASVSETHPVRSPR